MSAFTVPAAVLLLAICLALASLKRQERLEADQIAAPQATDAAGHVLNLVLTSPEVAQQSLVWLNNHWDDRYAVLLLEALPSLRSAEWRQQVFELLEMRTGADLPRDVEAWFRWVWARPYNPPAGYAAFKGNLYGQVDNRFRAYFREPLDSDIRLDEIRWGGVRQDGIPPLRKPDMLAADVVSYLADSNIVFGLVIEGEARAYPKRVLAHHEMVIDRVASVDITGVYCTLCGAMIAYESDGHVLGTSGFLYRSNKLMFDAATQSLWNTFTGHPVVGALADSDIFLRRHPVVTTTWGQWKRAHPQTRVLGSDTGYARNYAEGAAYRDYLASDALMFTVPASTRQSSLANKDEVLALRSGGDRLALSVAFLGRHRLHHDELDGQPIVIVTDPAGASRVYASRTHRFTAADERAGTLTDAQGQSWEISEAALAGPNGETLDRLPAHRAFWFGWSAMFPDTRLRE